MEIKPAKSGLTLCELLFVAFLVLKLCGVIAWSWWWVAAPLWVPLALMIVVGVVAGLVWALLSLLGY